MINLNKHTKKTKFKPEPTRKFKNCSHVWTYNCARLSYTTQHRIVLIIVPHNLQTIVTEETSSHKFLTTT